MRFAPPAAAPVELPSPGKAGILKAMRLPQCRSGDYSLERLHGEAVLYEHDRDRAHWLSADALVVWDACQRGDEVAAVRRRLAERHGRERGDELFAAALGELVSRNLVEPAPPRLSRRWLLRRAAVGAALVATLAAPPALAQMTCIRSGNPCPAPPKRCCSSVCDGAGTPPRCL